MSLLSACTAVCFSCRLLHFEVVDAAGELQPLDRMELIKEPLKLTGGENVNQQQGSVQGWDAYCIFRRSQTWTALGG